jgi:hypothetical protein
MTKAAAYAMLDAMETVQMGGSVVMRFVGGVEQTFAVQLDPAQVFTGVQLGELSSYCATHGLTLSAQFTAIGIT